MEREEIKSECEILYKKIEDSKTRLKELRNICKHEETFIGNYSYRIGSSMPDIICSTCNHLIKYITE